MATTQTPYYFPTTASPYCAPCAPDTSVTTITGYVRLTREDGSHLLYAPYGVSTYVFEPLYNSDIGVLSGVNPIALTYQGAGTSAIMTYRITYPKAFSIQGVPPACPASTSIVVSANLGQDPAGTLQRQANAATADMIVNLNEYLGDAVLQGNPVTSISFYGATVVTC